MLIVAMTGAIGSGKTTIAEMLAAQVAPAGHWESWQIIAEIANELHGQAVTPTAEDIEAINRWLGPLPKLVEKVTNVQAGFKDLKLRPERIKQRPEYYAKLFDYLKLLRDDPQLRKLSITPESKEAFRSLLQWLGGYLVATLDNGIWYNEIIRRIKSEPCLQLATIGGLRFPSEAEIVRGAGGVVLEIIRPGEAVRDGRDVTERERAQIVSDAQVYNNGNLADLKRCASNIVADLQSGTLQPVYRAAANKHH